MKREFVRVRHYTKPAHVGRYAYDSPRWHGTTKTDRTLCGGIQLHDYGTIQAVMKAERIPEPACKNCAIELERGR